MNSKIRHYRKADFPIILEIYASSKLDELRFEDTAFELLPLESDTQRLAELMESDIFVYENDCVVAYGALFRSEIRALFVHPSARSKGIGRCLLEFLLSKTHDHAKLYVARTNAPAMQLYASYGFEVTAEFQTQYNGIPVLANEMVQIATTGNKQ